MAKLNFFYGVMDSGKTLSLLTYNNNYFRKGHRTVVFKPSIDTRDDSEVVLSRLGVWTRAYPVSPDDNLKNIVAGENIQETVSCVFLDEAQFFSEEQILQLSEIADELDIPVLAYGLRTDSNGKLFVGSKALMELADELIEIGQVCSFCDKKARMNLRFDDHGNVVRGGNPIHIGDTEYRSVCRKHFKSVNSLKDVKSRVKPEVQPR